MKGIILAGGLGTRLAPLTKVISKQLLPVYNKPMIYYPLATLMSGGIRDFAIITTKETLQLMQKLLGDGSSLGVNIEYLIQDYPGGIAESFLIAENFIQKDPACLILGDNIFYGPKLGNIIEDAAKKVTGAKIFGYKVSDPMRYGVIKFDNQNKISDIIEKPQTYISSYAVSGLYIYDSTVVEKAKTLKPSKRGELEITDLNKIYLNEGKLELEIIPEGYLWFDAGTFDSLLEASHFVQSIEKRHAKVGCIKTISKEKGWME